MRKRKQVVRVVVVLAIAGLMTFCLADSSAYRTSWAIKPGMDISEMLRMARGWQSMNVVTLGDTIHAPKSSSLSFAPSGKNTVRVVHSSFDQPDEEQTFPSDEAARVISQKIRESKREWLVTFEFSGLPSPLSLHVRVDASGKVAEVSELYRAD